MHTLNTTKKPATKDWHVADIKAALEKAGWTLRRLSLHHGFAAGSLREALYRPWPNAERIIADAIGCKPAAIWPTRYSFAVRPRRGVGGKPTHIKHGTSAVCGHEQ